MKNNLGDLKEVYINDNHQIIIRRLFTHHSDVWLAAFPKLAHPDSEFLKEILMVRGSPVAEPVHAADVLCKDIIDKTYFNINKILPCLARFSTSRTWSSGVLRYSTRTYSAMELINKTIC